MKSSGITMDSQTVESDIYHQKSRMFSDVTSNHDQIFGNMNETLVLNNILCQEDAHQNCWSIAFSSYFQSHGRTI